MTGPQIYDLTIRAKLVVTAGGATPAVTVGPAVATLTPTPVTTPATPLGKRVKLGAFVYRGLEGAGGSGDPWDPAPHMDLERRLGKALHPVSCFLGWDTDFPTTQLAAYGTRQILISWQPTSYTAAVITSGLMNAYIDRFAAAVDRYGTVYIRLMPEMNGNWSRWSPAYTGDNPMGITSPADYIRVWRYVVDRVRRTTAKVKWVWCPNITDNPNTDGNRLEQFYPGDSHVDVLGFDGYNWGDSSYGNFTWTSFHDLVGTPQGGAAASIYDRLTALHPTAPIWLCETGCKDPAKDDGKTAFNTDAVAPGLSPANPAQSKAQWYTDMLAETGFPRLAAIVAFHITKERDWRLDSSPGVLDAIAAAVK